MSWFELSEVETYDGWKLPPHIVGERLGKQILSALALEPDLAGEIQIRIGRVWDRKGYPHVGSVSSVEEPSAYRTSEDQLYVTISYLINLYNVTNNGTLDDIHLQAVEEATAAHEKRLEDERRKKLAQIDKLQAEIDKIKATIT